MDTLDLTESTRRTAAVVRGTTDDQLDDPTPCEEMTVRLLLAHLHGLAFVFRDAARKIEGSTTNTPPDPAGLVLPADWRESIPVRLENMAAAWNETGSRRGTTAAGGQSMPADVALLVALDEVVLHGWDLAVATGQDYAVEQDALDAVEQFCAEISDDPGEREGLFGPRVPVPDGSDRWDRVLGQAGRNPAWTSTAVGPPAEHGESQAQH